ncbi:hypothetical protein GCM10020221_20450 [Streptomyces thioluteus]|uniref:Uncharacterized protein n=1 Tax=Streptomyces thioluteus TaxID=66431 RepID=A0ABN3WS34_STRTU
MSARGGRPGAVLRDAADRGEADGGLVAEQQTAQIACGEGEFRGAVGRGAARAVLRGVQEPAAGRVPVRVGDLDDERAGDGVRPRLQQRRDVQRGAATGSRPAW